jgi:hypothetical protein
MLEQELTKYLIPDLANIVMNYYWRAEFNKSLQQIKDGILQITGFLEKPSTC